MSLFERIVFWKIALQSMHGRQYHLHGVTDTIHAILPGFQKWCPLPKSLESKFHK